VKRDEFERLFWLWFAVCAVVGLAFAGVIVWAVIAIVSWLVTK